MEVLVESHVPGHVELTTNIFGHTGVQFNPGQRCVQMKTYSVIELALKRRFPASATRTLAPLLKEALAVGLLKDSGFRHLKDPDPNNSYCHRLVEVLPKLRNSAAHGSTNLTPDCVGHIEKCADLVNQLFGHSALSRKAQLLPPERP